MPSCLPSHVSSDSDQDDPATSDGTCSRIRPGMLWRTANFTVCGRSADGGWFCGCGNGMVWSMQFRQMVEGKQNQRHPHGGRSLGADFEKGESRQTAREQYLHVDRIVGQRLHFAVEILEEIHGHPRDRGMLRQKFGLILDLAGDIIDLVARTLVVNVGIVIVTGMIEMMMKVGFAFRVVFQNDAARFGLGMDLGKSGY